MKMVQKREKNIEHFCRGLVNCKNAFFMRKIYNVYNCTSAITIMDFDVKGRKGRSILGADEKRAWDARNFYCLRTKSNRPNLRNYRVIENAKL